MRQTAIWIDHDEARIFHVDGETIQKDTVRSANHHVRRHPKSQETRTHNHPQDEARFFSQVLALLDDSREMLIMGPAITKLHLLRYVQAHAPAVAARIVGIETSAHPTDGQLSAHIRHYFHNDPPRVGLPA